MLKLGMDWFKNARTPEEKEKVQALVLNSEPLLDLLRQILEMRKMGMTAFTEKNYENPSWAHLQAHRNGRIEEIDYLLKLLTPKER